MLFFPRKGKFLKSLTSLWLADFCAMGSSQHFWDLVSSGTVQGNTGG